MDPNMSNASLDEPVYTEEELEEYKQVFALFDTDGSGAIGCDELGEAMRSMGMAPVEKELENLIKEIDVDGNGEVDFDEFCQCMKRMTNKKESDEEIIRSCFAVFDQDRNGIVSEGEFRRVFREIGNFKEREIDEIFRETDVDGDGQIDVDEFTQMVRMYLLEDTVDTEGLESQASTLAEKSSVKNSSDVESGPQISVPQKDAN